jgi:glycosyltransferase involved in cell wall biosynthesis
MSHSTHNLVSIIIPCYNQGRFLPEAVASVVAQSYPHRELIIVDDGSTDDTAAIAEQQIAAHAGHAIRLIRQPNSGLSASRNAGIAAARGPYILPLDADDALEPEMLAATVAVLDAQPAVGFVYTDVLMVGVETTRWSGGEYSLTKLLFDCPSVPMTLFRKAGWEAVGGFQGNLHPQGYEDWDFWLSLAQAGWLGYHVPQPLVRYRRANNSMLAHARRHDLELRAQLVLRHEALYPAGFGAWARRVAQWSDHGQLGSRRWWQAFGQYAWLVARYQPRLVPKTLLRPFFVMLSARQQGWARRVARRLRLTQAS